MREPFIKRLRTPRGYYFFDVNKNTLIEVSNEVYDFFDKDVDGKSVPQNIQAEIDNIINQGYLSNYHVEVIEYPDTDKLQYLCDNYMRHLILQVTQNCNLSCIYCPYACNTSDVLQRKHSSKNMEFETAKRAIDYFFDHSKESKRVIIGFYGGEPLISYDLIKKCVMYANGLFEGKKVSYVLTTNATLLTDEMINFFNDNNFLVTFSIDGPKKIHDKNRVKIDGKGTYDLVVKNIKKTIEIFDDSKNRISINMVIDPKDDFDLISEWLESELVSSISFSASMVDNRNLENKFLASEEYLEKFRYHLGLALLDYTCFVDDLKYSLIVKPELENIKKEYYELKENVDLLPQKGIPTGPCISGQHKLFVSANGDFYPCERVNENSEAMKIGSIDKGIDIKKVSEQINAAQNTENECKNCWVFLHCDLCQAYADGIDTLNSNEKKAFCIDSREGYLDILHGCVLIDEVLNKY